MSERLPTSSRIARTVEEAQAIILSARSPLPPIDVPVADALGLILATPLVAAQDSPSFATAAMDGFAIRAADSEPATIKVPVELQIAGIQPAGDAAAVDVTAGTAVRIMTGASCPPGADAVVPFELTEVRSQTIAISRPVASGTNIRPQGEEYRENEALLAVGTELGPGHLALLAANGYGRVSVRRPARVAIIAAGNELREPGATLEPGQIWDSNSIMVTSLCRKLGAEVVIASLISDRDEEIAASWDVARTAEVDLVITIGGISAGDFDRLKVVLTRRGDVELWDVAMRPGRPLAYGRVDGIPVIGLPGNPAAAFVAFHQFIRPLLSQMSGRAHALPTLTATALETFQNRGGRRNFIRVVVEHHDGRYVVRSAGAQGAASILSLAQANGLLVIPASVERIEVGEPAVVQLLDHVEHYGNVVSMWHHRESNGDGALDGQEMR